jgi:hypothetical protein
MTTTHTVREWLEQLPEPYRTEAIFSLSAYDPEKLDAYCDNMAYAINAIVYDCYAEGNPFWSVAWHKYKDQPFKEPLTVKALQNPATNSPLSDLLDPSEGWTQEGFVWWNAGGDKIKSRAADYEVGISCGEGNKIYIKYFLAPTVLSAMAMVNQYRREQWQ